MASRLLGVLFLCMLTQSLFAGYVDFAAQFALQPEKYQAWQEMVERVNQMGDRLGSPVDEKIKETVVVLNLLGSRTIASCEGHLDWGCCYPWIDIGMEQEAPEQLMQEWEVLKEQVGQITTISNEEIKILERFHVLEDLMTQYRLQQLSPVHQLLEEFYATSNALFYTVQIGEQHFPSAGLRIYSRDGEWQLIRQENEKKAKLLEYQREMERFTNFLIKKFLDQSNRAREIARKTTGRSLQL
jgi:hypothetical protein